MSHKYWQGFEKTGTLIRGWWDGAATLANRLAVPQSVKHSYYMSSNPTPNYLSKRTETWPHKNLTW